MLKEENGLSNCQRKSPEILSTAGGFTRCVIIVAIWANCGRTLIDVPPMSFLTSRQLLAAIGEMFETPFGPSDSQVARTAGDQVTGIIMSSRKAFYRINIWTRDSDDKSKVEHIGQHLKYDVLGFAEGSSTSNRRSAAEGKGLQSDVEFVSHKASQTTKNPKGWTV